METPATRQRQLKERIKIPNSPEAVMHFEAFVRSLAFLTEREKMPLLVAGDEVVDNLLNHGEVGRQGIRAVVRKRANGISLGIFVQSHKRFAQFAACLDEDPPSGPRYNPQLRRWHGLGLTMCRNLARSVHYRAGERMDRVFLEFPLNPGR
jgi:hypothetical protein